MRIVIFSKRSGSIDPCEETSILGERSICEAPGESVGIHMKSLPISRSICSVLLIFTSCPLCDPNSTKNVFRIEMTPNSISLSEFKIFQYRPSTPVIQNNYRIGDYCKDKRLVEYCGDLCVVLRLCKIFRVKGVDKERTVGFKVYKMDKKLVEWVEVSSLGDKAIIMCMESCLMVSASEYYGCLEKAIYFTDDDGRDKRKGEDIVKVFKLEGGMIDSSSQSFLEMFTPPFL
ncbi:unnamed protein product [Microthlaspi erraticum]|uniref:KIB1-4 beta-propeller domain-containing protein n=1 Tax=Microthlaspi erraticum TaxID=1685480 RepID=A0A6D2J061_9BRAS|nr:unnamed protein product [Microthlaspi erraticum]